MKKFLLIASNQLEGDWVLMGGTLLPALGIDHRVTTDIDLVPLDPNINMQATHRLMKLADSMGLSVESVNSAAGYFLEKIPGFRKSLVLLSEGKKSRIYRPNTTLYILLKIKRMTESDLEDCLQLLKWARKQKESIQKKKILAAIHTESTRPEQSDNRLKRLESLRSQISSHFQ